MNSSVTDNQLTIVNRSTEHHINRQLIRKIPYFEMMLSHDVMETKENKVTLDFDEDALKSFLNWVEYDRLLVRMSYAINLYILTDYFGMDELMQKCTEYFHTRFSIEHLPTVIPQVTEDSVLINSGILNTFICRHFFKIANATFWCEYPIEIIEYICALDLMIYSEYQVFEAISRWTNFKADSRKCYLERLLKLVRWCYLEDKYLSKIKESETSIPQTESGPSSKRNCPFNRTKQNCFIILEEFEDTDLRVIVLDNNFRQLLYRDLEICESISLNLLHGEHISDIFYHSGRKAIRIDWNQNKYRFITSYHFRSYFKEFCGLVASPEMKYKKSPGYESIYRYTIRSAADERSIRSHGHDEEFEFWLTKIMQTDAKFSNNSELLNWPIRLRETVLSNNIFILKNNLEFGRFNVNQKKFKKIELPKLEERLELEYENLFITSSVDHADRVFLIDKSTENVYGLNVNNQKWSLIGDLLVDPFPASYSKRSPDYSRKESNKFISLIPAFLPLDIISTC